MAGKVFHVSDGIHQQAREFCERHGLQTKVWVEAVICQALRLKLTNPENMGVGSFTVERPSGPPVVIVGPASRPEAVPKKPMTPETPEKQEAVPPWERPPFWARRGSTENQNGS